MKRPLTIRLLCLLAALILTLGAAGCDAFRSPVYYPVLDEGTIASFPSKETEYKLTEADLGLENMEIAAEDSLSILYYNPTTTEIALKRKTTGEVWFSNPQDRTESSDPLINAQLHITTLNGRDVEKQWNTYDDSVVYGQFYAEKTAGGVTVRYLVGKKPAEILYPAGMTEKRYQELLDLIPTDKSKGYLKRLYGRADLSTISSAQQREDLKKNFTKLEELGGSIYILRSQLSKLEQKNLAAAFNSAGYTAAMKTADEAEVGYAGTAESDDRFTIAVTYTLENGALVVDLNPSQIQSTHSLKISEITVLRNFGAQKPGSRGFLFVPDGSGAIIDADTPESTAWSGYKRSVYGQDYGVLRTDRAEYSEQLYLPVYGIFGPGGGFVGIAERDDGQMSVMAGVAGDASGYGTVCPNFTLLTYALVSLESSAKNALNLYPRKAVDDPIRLRYLFSDRPDTGYDDLAILLRDYMIGNGSLDGVNDRNGLAVVANAYGAIDEIQSILGYPAPVTKTLTSFDETAVLAGELKTAAPDGDIIIGYTGWQRGGIKTGYIKKPETEGKLGSNAKLADLARKLDGLGVVLMPVTEPQYCHDAKAGQGFRPMSQSIRFITRDTGYKPHHNIASYYMDENGLTPYIIRPELTASNMASFTRAFRQLNIGGIGIGVMASELYSDFRTTNVLSRNDTIRSFKNAVRSCRENARLVGGYGANAYALFGLDYALGLPVTSSNHPIITRSVPFLQIVLSGSVSYTMPELNKSADPARYLLKAVETGSGIYFDYFAAEGSAIRGTDYDWLYSASRSSIWESASAISADAAAALSEVANHRILSHEMLQEGVFQTVYDNGYTCIVNYNQTAQAGVPAMGFRLTAPQAEG